MSAGECRIYINGRFLEQPLSGVQRYAREMVSALDRLLDTRQDEEQWTLLTTGRESEALDLNRIQVCAVPSALRGHAWEQTSLFRAARDGCLIGFGASGPIFHPNQLVVMHDASVFRHPEFFSPQYSQWHRLMGRLLARRAHIATVSHFSQAELGEVLGLDPSRIPVFYNGSDHMRRIVPSSVAVDRLRLHDRRYFVLVGNLSKNKNLAVAIEALKRTPEAALVVVGGLNPKIFGTCGFDVSDERLILAGRLDDTSLAGLLRQTAGLLFPSFYEGFGIPPLEAMVNTCPVIASDIPAVREVCGDAATYFDPHSADELAARMRELLLEPAELTQARRQLGVERAARFSWDSSALALLTYCRHTLLAGEKPPSARTAQVRARRKPRSN